MRFHVTNRHNGRKYPAEGEHWPEHGWHIKIYDFDPNAWGRAEDGIGHGPVMDQGWKPELERRGYEFPPLTQPVNVRDQEIDRLAKLIPMAGILRKEPPAPPAEPPAPPAPPTTESKIDWSKRLAALRKRRGESVAESIVTKLLD